MSNKKVKSGTALTFDRPYLDDEFVAELNEALWKFKKPQITTIDTHASWN